ncbi:MAG: YggS family pyridoxal phosphate-dependent enzyme [Actinobacteria bacterium]|nr:YggS family pyridoxal phosphate-dependent enzyme [Actinomycetota bacterium]MCB9412310.1 YggS family pyridoxal phosphate-dependent enzyme [Actinomycetota bacterium]
MTSDDVTSDAQRLEALAASVAAARAEVEAAERAAGRSPGAVDIVAVTKKFPASDVIALASLGIRHVGENRHQEAVAKHSAAAAAPVTWHFIGQLQTNKARAVAAYADQIDTVDRLGLVAALERGAAAHGRNLGCLVQVNLDPSPAAHAGRGGADPADVLDIADAVAAAEHLELRGVMGMAPADGDAEAAFDRLAAIAESIRSRYPQADQISAGMSGDFEAAIAAGATHVRLGTAILGPRPAVG